MKNYSVLMGNAMNLCKDMPNRSDSAKDLLHDTVTKTLDYFSKGKDLPLEEMHFWMIRVMENTFKDIKKSARSRLEVQQATSTSENNDDSDYTDIKRTTVHAVSNAREIDVSDADNKLFRIACLFKLMVRAKSTLINAGKSSKLKGNGCCF